MDGSTIKTSIGRFKFSIIKVLLLGLVTSWQSSYHATCYADGFTKEDDKG